MIRLVLFWCFVSTSAFANESCPEVISTATLSRFISEADMAFSTMDEQGFRTARWSAQRAVPCLGEPIQPGQAAAYYRMEALGNFVDQQHAQTVGFFRSMLKVAPNYLLPEAMAPEGHPLRVNFEVALGSVPVAGKPIPRASDGLIRLDGAVAGEYPTDRPYLFQHVSDAGTVVASTVVGIGAEPPKYATGRGHQSANAAARSKPSTVAVKRSPVANGAKKPFRVNVPLAALSGGAAVVSGITYAIAVSSETKFFDPTTPKQDLAKLRQNTNTLVWVSGGFATLAVGSGVSAVLVGEF